MPVVPGAGLGLSLPMIVVSVGLVFSLVEPEQAIKTKLMSEQAIIFL